jgi:hypothetical protein
MLIFLVNTLIVKFTDKLVGDGGSFMAELFLVIVLFATREITS